MGFVDMEKIFREYPDTQKARAEYYKVLERRRGELAALEQELTRLEAPSEAPAASPAPSTGLFSLPPELAVSTPVAEVDPAEREAERQRKKEEITAARRTAAQELRALEEKKSLQILGTLYKTLTQLAQERGVDVVVDKSFVLFGQEAVDLTEPLARRLRGLPDAAPAEGR